MVPQAIVQNNPFEGMTVRGVRQSFQACPVKSTAALAVFVGSLYWGVKAARKSGVIGTAVKGLLAVTLAKKAKNSLMATSRQSSKALTAG